MIVPGYAVTDAQNRPLVDTCALEPGYAAQRWLVRYQRVAEAASWLPWQCLEQFQRRGPLAGCTIEPVSVQVTR